MFLKNKQVFLLVCSIFMTACTTLAQPLGRYSTDFGISSADFCDTIAIEWENNQVYVPVKMGKDTYRFLFDTGAGQAVVFSGTPLARSKQVGSLLSHDATGHTDTVKVVELPPMTLGTATLYECQATVQPSGLGSRNIDGILGFDLVNGGLSLKIDVAARHLIISDRKHVFDKEAGVKVKYRLDYHVPYIDVQPFGRHTEHVLFDTGSRQLFSINKQHFDEAQDNLKKEGRAYAVEGRSVGRYAMGHGGIEREGEVVFLRLDSMGVGGYSFSDVHCLTTQGGSHVGARLLEYGSVAFCPRHSLLLFQPYQLQQPCRVGNQQMEIAFVADARGCPQVGLVWQQGEPYQRGFRQGDVIESIDKRPVLSLRQFIGWAFERGREYVFTVRSPQGKRRDIRWVRLR